MRLCYNAAFGPASRRARVVFEWEIFLRKCQIRNS